MHEIFMRRALELALNGWGTTNPNPLVGAVIVKDGWVIGEGFHRKPGGDHAEVNAIKNASQDVRGAALYVNLEPCSHFGRTPPCADAIIKAGISKVVVGMEDPNPLVAGKGVEILRKAGIEVEVGILENDARKLNEIFIKYITKKRPFVMLKMAMSLDGKICTSQGESKWISSEESRRYVHHLRNRFAAVMVGTNTVIKDNPQLTARLEDEERNPVRIVLDRTGRIPLNSKVFDSNADIIAAVSKNVESEKINALESKGVKVLITPEEDQSLNLEYIMDRLYEMQIDSILIEGGGEIAFSALNSGIVDKVMVFIAPLIIGGRNALTPVEGNGFSSMEKALKLKNISTKTIGSDILIEGYTYEFHEMKESDKEDGCVYGHCAGNGCCKRDKLCGNCQQD